MIALMKMYVSAGGDDGGVRRRFGDGEAERRQRNERQRRQRLWRLRRCRHALADALLVPVGPLRQEFGLSTLQLRQVPAHGPPPR